MSAAPPANKPRSVGVWCSRDKRTNSRRTNSKKAITKPKPTMPRSIRPPSQALCGWATGSMRLSLTGVLHSIEYIPCGNTGSAST